MFGVEKKAVLVGWLLVGRVVFRGTLRFLKQITHLQDFGITFDGFAICCCYGRLIGGYVLCGCFSMRLTVTMGSRSCGGGCCAGEWVGRVPAWIVWMDGRDRVELWRGDRPGEGINFTGRMTGGLRGFDTLGL